MAFACASLIHCTRELVFLAVITWTCVFCQFPGPTLKVAYLGLSFKLHCPVPVDDNTTGNYIFSFFHKPLSQIKKLNITGSNNHFIQDKSILTITKVRFDDGGTYSCEVRNQTNHLLEKINLAFVIVQKAPIFGFKMYPDITSTLVDEGNRYELRCEYNRVGAKITWWRVNQKGSNISEVIPREKISVKNNAKKTIERYVIEKISLDDSGGYRCEVKEGSKSRFTPVLVLQVIENEKPSFGHVEGVFNASEGDVDFEIELLGRGEPYPNITCSREGKEIISCSGKTIKESTLFENPCRRDHFEITIEYYLVITDVFYSDHHGQYSCIVTNIAGSANTTFTVDVTVRPIISVSNSAFFYHVENKKGIVTCTVREANPRPVINWYSQELRQINDQPKQDKWVLSNLKQSLISLPGGRYEGTLTIPANQGKSFYMSNATNVAGSDTRVYKFLRYSSGKDPVVVTPRGTVELNEGETFVAVCKVVNSITGKIVFFKENSGMEIVNKTGTKITLRKGREVRKLTISITNLTVNDSGTYRCTEEKLTNQKAGVNLKVKLLRPTAIFSLRNKTVTESLHTIAVELFCNISGNPLPKVTWLRNDRTFEQIPLTESNCKNIQPGYYYYKDVPQKLIICNPRRTHTALYTCFAKNQLGNKSRNAYLDVLSAPKFVSPISLKKEKKNKGDRYIIRCKAVGNPRPFVQWVKDGTTSNHSTELSIEFSDLVIESMDESYEGNYSCSAKNHLETVVKRLLEIEMIQPVKPIPERSSGLSTGAIIGIVIGIFVAVIVALILCLIYQRTQRRKMLFYKHQYFLKTGDYSLDPSRTLNEQSLSLFYDSDWEFPYERLVIGDRLGAGAFGEVSKAEAMGILALNARDKSGVANKRRSKLRRSLRASQRAKKRASSDPVNATVAVKTVKATATESEIRDLAAELKIMIHLGQHKNIVNLLGACTTGRRLYVILEFCPHGDLLSFLRGKRDLYASTWVKEVFDPEKEFTLIDLVGAAFQVAKGMEFLSEKKLIHRDLAARNILVGDEYVMKISDFGLARDIYTADVYVKTSSGLLPVKWMAIESLFDRVYTHQSDVWSFGILLWEIMTLGGTPYPGLPAEELLDYLHNGKRMPQPTKCPLEVYTIMRDCWQEQPEQRPTFAGLVEHLGRMLERHMAKDNPYLKVLASPEEIEAAKEKDSLLQSKSDYYLQPLLLTTKHHGYDPNAPLPTPPTNVATPTYDDGGEPEFDKKAEPSKLKGTGSYELLREDEKAAGENAQLLSVSLDKESGIALQDMNGKDSKASKANKAVKHTETIV